MITAISTVPQFVTIEFDDAPALTITLADILEHYHNESGTVAQRKAATVAWAKGLIREAAGLPDMEINFTFSVTNEEITSFSSSGGDA